MKKCSASSVKGFQIDSFSLHKRKLLFIKKNDDIYLVVIKRYFLCFPFCIRVAEFPRSLWANSYFIILKNELMTRS
jgi:hypothetical protein